MPLTVTVKDSSGNPVANVGFTLSRGDSKNRAGMVITDGDVAADAGADDLMLKELTPASASQSMTTTGIVFTGTTGSDGTATFTLNQDKSLGLKTPLTVKVTDNTTLHASLDVILWYLPARIRIKRCSGEICRIRHPSTEKRCIVRGFRLNAVRRDASIYQRSACK